MDKKYETLIDVKSEQPANLVFFTAFLCLCPLIIVFILIFIEEPLFSQVNLRLLSPVVMVVFISLFLIANYKFMIPRYVYISSEGISRPILFEKEDINIVPFNTIDNFLIQYVQGEPEDVIVTLKNGCIIEYSERNVPNVCEKMPSVLREHGIHETHSPTEAEDMREPTREEYERDIYSTLYGVSIITSGGILYMSFLGYIKGVMLLFFVFLTVYMMFLGQLRRKAWISFLSISILGLGFILYFLPSTIDKLVNEAFVDDIIYIDTLVVSLLPIVGLSFLTIITLHLSYLFYHKPIEQNSDKHKKRNTN